MTSTKLTFTKLSRTLGALSCTGLDKGVQLWCKHAGSCRGEPGTSAYQALVWADGVYMLALVMGEQGEQLQQGLLLAVHYFGRRGGLP